MAGFLRRNELNACVSQGAHVNSLQQWLEHIVTVAVQNQVVGVSAYDFSLKQDTQKAPAHDKDHSTVRMYSIRPISKGTPTSRARSIDPAMSHRLAIAIMIIISSQTA